MVAFYNEIDPFAAQWLRELIKAGMIAPGVVDERDIRDIKPDELRAFTQCHFFAGIGVWSYALRRAGWRDSTRIWTMSCPCQPFSDAGAGNGFDDERHLWPHAHWLIQNCRPEIVVGEQVASKDGLAWFDLVQADLEGTNYASVGTDMCAAGFGAPHIRQRLYWMAYDNRIIGEQGCSHDRRGNQGSDAHAWAGFGRSGSIERLADSDSDRLDQRWLGEPATGNDGAFRNGSLGRLDNNDDEGLERYWLGHKAASGRHGAVRSASETSEFGGMADSDRTGSFSGAYGSLHCGEKSARSRNGEPERPGSIGCLDNSGRPGPTNGFWRDADWLFCRDGKWRPVEPGTFPLAHGSAARVGRLRGYGNAINAEQATIFLEAAEEILIEKSILPRVVELL